MQKFDDADNENVDEDQVEERQILNEDTSLDTPVDPNAYENLKKIRNRIK